MGRPEEAERRVRHFRVRGKVRSIMFRQTFIRGLQKRSLEGGASNVPGSYDTALVGIRGTDADIDRFLGDLQSMSSLNSWGASVEETEEIPGPPSIEQYQVTTVNVDRFPWNPDIEMYL